MLAYGSARVAVMLLVLGAAGAGAPPVHAQGAVPIKVTITVAGSTETVRGAGECGHEPRAWLYGAPASLWLVEYTGTGPTSGLSLSYWRLGDEEQQFSLAVRRKKSRHRISTVEGGTLEGTGRATFHPTASGGRFEITGKAQDGAALQVTIECARFGGIQAEGG